jgi:hypothetical protein
MDSDSSPSNRRSYLEARYTLRSPFFPGVYQEGRLDVASDADSQMGHVDEFSAFA